MSSFSSSVKMDEILYKDIIELLGLSSLSEEEKKKLRDKILKTIENRVALQITQEIQKRDKVAGFENIKGDDEAVDRFFKENRINIQQIHFDQTLAYKAQLIAAGQMVDIGLNSSKQKTSHTNSI